MEMRTLGQNGPLVSRLGLGLAALGRPGYINLGHAEDLAADYAVTHMQDRSVAVMDAAWKAGIRYYDAARSYGRAEAFLGHWLRLRHHAAGALTVGSKWGYTYTADWQVQADKHEVKDHSLSVLNRQWIETQAEIGPWLDLYQIHSATLDSGVLDRLEVLQMLAKHKAAGTAIGLSLSGPAQGDTLRKALKVRIDGVPLFDVVQASWNLLEPSAGPVLADAHAAGWGIIIKEGLANGRLTPRNNMADFTAQMQVLETQAQRLGCTVDALALAGILARPWVDVVLSGAARVAHLESNLGALQVNWDAEAETRLQSIIEPAGTYWQIRKGLAWN